MNFNKLQVKTAMEIYQAHKNPVSKIKVLTPQEQAEKEDKAKESKYKNVPIVIDDILFQSTGEGHYYLEMKQRMLRGDIKEFKRQVPFTFFVDGVRVGKYVADFVALHYNGALEVIDFKSKFTIAMPLYKLKKQLMLSCFQLLIKEVGVK